MRREKPLPRVRCIPPDGPSDEAMKAFAEAIAQGLRDQYPGWDFIVRRRRTTPPAKEPSGLPDDGDAVGGV